MPINATLNNFRPGKTLCKRLTVGSAALLIYAFLGFYAFQANETTSFIKLCDSSLQSNANPITEQGFQNISFNNIPAKKLSVKLPDTFTLSEASNEDYFIKMASGLSCFRSGTDLKKTAIMSHQQINATCSCLPGYFGRDCGIPESVWLSCISDFCQNRLVQRQTPRRLIHGININHELEFFEARLSEIGKTIDVLIVAESNITAGGDTSELYLLPKLKEGFMEEYQHKIIHVLIDQFPPQGLIDGWYADTFIRNHMGKEGLRRIRGIRDDDLFLLLDADEIPNEEVLLFFKLYDGYPEPITLKLRWSVFGFFWKRRRNDWAASNAEQVTEIAAICTIRMLREVYDNNVMSLRRNHVGEEPVSSKIHKYAENGNHVLEWRVGIVGNYAGFHCSWCYPPEGIRLKLWSAQKDDKPRWGDYPEKMNLTYISSLIKQGRWFDDTQPFFSVLPMEDQQYAPKFFLLNWKRFDYLLTPPMNQILENT